MKTLNILTEICMRLFRFSVGVLANVMNIIVSLIIILLNVYVSWNHTLELFHEAGFTRAGYMDIAGVCAVELTFLLGSCHVIGARMKGRIPGIGSIITGGLGVALIMWSNISAGVSHGITGVIVGIVVPLSIVACETILADAWRAQTQATPEEQKEPKPSDSRVGHLLKELKESDSKHIMSNPTPDIKQKESEETVPNIKEKVSEEPVPDTKEKESEETIPDIKQKVSEEPIPDIKQKESDESKANTKKKASDKSDEETARAFAVRLRNETGKFPSIRKLMQETNVSKYRAEMVLKELKQTAV